MARPTFTPDDDQRRTLDAIGRLAARLAKIDAEMDKLIAMADKQGIPINRIAETAKVQRKTVYRHLGKKMR